jgi:hypothetical protein
LAITIGVAIKPLLAQIQPWEKRKSIVGHTAKWLRTTTDPHKTREVSKYRVKPMCSRKYTLIEKSTSLSASFLLQDEAGAGLSFNLMSIQWK